MVLPAAMSGVSAAVILAISRAIGETMIVAIAAGQQPRLTANPLVPIETMTAYIVQVSLGDVPAGTTASTGRSSRSACCCSLGTLVLNLCSDWLRRRMPGGVAMIGARRLDRAFHALGLAVLVLALGALGLLLWDVTRDGAGRLSWAFLSGYPSRRAANAGLLPALAGSVWLIVLAALMAVPVGVGAAIALEEYGGPRPLGAARRDQHRQPRRRAVDRLRAAGPRAVRARAAARATRCWPAPRRWRC